MCDHPVGRFSGVHVESGNSFAVDTILGCGRWNCPGCGKKKLSQLFKRIFTGKIANLDLPDGFRAKFFVKFLTLTVPGRQFRDTHSPDDSFVIIAHYWDTLLKSVRKTYGNDFLYFRVVERQKDGYPHYHVLLVGRSISGKSVYDYIRRMWCDVYGMGFVKLNVVDSVRNAFGYLLKYITKGFGSPSSSLPFRIRLFSSSRSALAVLPKTAWAWKRVVVGSGVDISPERTYALDFPFESRSDRSAVFTFLQSYILGGFPYVCAN